MTMGGERHRVFRPLGRELRGESHPDDNTGLGIWTETCS
jgi:hypothetical protein